MCVCSKTLMMLGKIRDFAIRTPPIPIHSANIHTFNNMFSFLLYFLAVSVRCFVANIYVYTCVHGVLQIMRETGKRARKMKGKKKRDRTSILCSFVCECECMALCMFVCCEYECIAFLSHWTVWALAKSNLKLWCFECDTNVRAHTHFCTQTCIKYGKQLSTLNVNEKHICGKRLSEQRRERMSECASTCTVCLLVRSHQW